MADGEPLIDWRWCYENPKDAAKLIDEARAENARLREAEDIEAFLDTVEAALGPPGADAMEIAEKLVTDWDNTNPALTMTELVAEAIEQAALAAREQAMEEAAQWHSDMMDESIEQVALDIEHHWRVTVHSESQDYFRALGQRKPG